MFRKQPFAHLHEGGPESGDYDHPGRPGYVGGSGFSVKNASVQSVTAKLRKAGFTPRKVVTTAVKGYHPTHEPGYVVWRRGTDVLVSHDAHAYYRYDHKDGEKMKAETADHEVKYAKVLHDAGLELTR